MSGKLSYERYHWFHGQVKEGRHPKRELKVKNMTSVHAITPRCSGSPYKEGTDGRDGAVHGAAPSRHVLLL